MSKIKKAVIPVAGAGTRFLPATKAMPKEMLPIIDKPVIQYIVEEAVASGIKDIILVTSDNKRPIEDHFDINEHLEEWLEKNGKHERAEEIRRIGELANFIYIRQKGPYGNGTPVLNAKYIIGDEPFAYMFGDDPFVNERKPRLKQLIEAYEKNPGIIMNAMEVDDEATNRYGMIKGEKIANDLYRVSDVVEKPGPKKAPSRVAAVGAYILTPNIFEALENTKLGKDNELWLVDAIKKIAKQDDPVYAKITEGTYYDTGSKLGWLKANVELGLAREDIGPEFRKYLENLFKILNEQTSD